VGQIAQQLFANGAAERVVACVMPKSRAAIDTVFSFCDRDACTVFGKWWTDRLLQHPTRP
jgi:arginine deiminase